MWRVRDRATFAAFPGGVRRRHGDVGVTRVRPPATEPDAPPQVAFQVGGRVGSAVTRNRVRRRLQAAVRGHAGLLDPGFAYLVVAAPGAKDATAVDLSDQLGRALRSFVGERTR